MIPGTEDVLAGNVIEPDPDIVFERELLINCSGK